VSLVTDKISGGEYACGLAFDPSREYVLLVWKNKPAWQAGKLNGVGGAFEPDADNSYRDTMAREFLEETGVETSPSFTVDFTAKISYRFTVTEEILDYFNLPPETTADELWDYLEQNDYQLEEFTDDRHWNGSVMIDEITNVTEDGDDE
jgi:8-oxo-dGTP pyrophosphatase MutT (NUDIX family)